MKETSSKHSFCTNFVNYSISFQFLHIPTIIFQILSDYLQSFKVSHNIQKWKISSDTLRISLKFSEHFFRFLLGYFLLFQNLWKLWETFKYIQEIFQMNVNFYFLRKRILSNSKNVYRLKFRKSVDLKCFGKMSHYLQNMYIFWENFR